MTRMIATRLLLTIPILLGVSIVAFGLMRALPGDFAQASAGTTSISAEGLEQIRRNLGLGSVTTFVYALLYAPIVVLVVYSFNRSRLSATWQGFTTEWYAALWRNDLLFQSLLNSLIVATAVTAVCVVVGTGAAIVTARRHLRGRAVVDGLAYLPLVIPEIVIAVSFVIFFSLLSLDLDLGTIILAHVTFCVSFVIP